MKKKILITALSILAIFLVSSIILSLRPKNKLVPIEYATAMEGKKPFIMLFYSDWCSSCMKFSGKYRMLKEIYPTQYDFVMINTDDPKSKNVLNDYMPTGLPTVYIVDPTIDNRILLNNAIYWDFGKLRAECDRYLRIHSIIEKGKAQSQN